MSEGLPRSEVYFGGSMDRTIGENTKVELTKFNALPVDNPQIIMTLTNEENYAISEIDNLKSLSANDLLQQQQYTNETWDKKWPWTTSGNAKNTFGDTCASSSPNQVAAKLTSQQILATKEPFQVVWRRLSFEVNLSTYDQFIGQVLRRVRSLWGLSKIEDSPSIGPSDLKGQLNHSQSTDLSLKVTSGGIKKRLIFENLNGYINSGEISAILGPSGSGKTSLLNAICGRVDNYRGSVQLIGGGKRRMRLSIIPQKDYLIENLTVRENLEYSSRILNTDKNFDHEANILRVVKMLNLINCFQSSAANISGGEYKRVSIAQELLKQPDILILDEPTSGLDSLNCKKLIKSLVQLIEASRLGTINPIAIVMTIHQPDVDIFQMFDHVYCMSKRGNVIFDGHPSEVMNVIHNHAGFSDQQSQAGTTIGPNCIGANPANLLIEIASEDLYGQEPIERLAHFQRKQFEQQTNSNHIPVVSSKETSGTQCDVIYTGNNKNFFTIVGNIDNPKNQSLTSFQNQNDLSASSTLSTASASSYTKEGHLVRDKRLNVKNDHSGKFWYHTGLLAKRAFTSTIRDPLMTLISMIYHLSIPFVMWTVYSQKTGTVRACPIIQREMDMISLISNNTMGMMGELQEELATALECSTMFFLSTYSFSMCSLSVAALAFPLNMHVLLKEVRNGWYSLTSYVFAKTIASFPFEVLFPVISLAMIYLMLGMPSSYLEWRLWAMALVMALISMISHTQGLIFGAFFMDSVQTAIFLASASTLPLTLLSGFTARIKYMPIFLQKLSWFSLYRYSSDSINIIRFGFGTCPCDKSTDEYLRTKEPTFSDIPANMKPLFTYYLTNTANYEPDTMITSAENSTMIQTTNSSLSSSVLSNVNYVGKILIPGVSNDLTLNYTARNEMIAKLEANEIDVFERMAELMARSFTYGRNVKSCDSVRSQLLTTAGAPKDEFLPILFGGMFSLLLAAKLILFVIVKFKIGSRV